MLRSNHDIRIAKSRAVEWSEFVSDGSRRQAAGYFRKNRPLGCGRPRCKLCQFEKIYHRPSPAYKRANEYFGLALKELEGNLVRKVTFS